MSTNTLDSLTTEELEQLLEKKKKAERAAKEKERRQYEAAKNSLVHGLHETAEEMHSKLGTFKESCTKVLNEFYDTLKKYGDLNEDNKGSFTIFSEDRLLKVEYKRNITFGFDERGEIAAAKLKMWLSDTVKKRDKDMHDFILGLLDKSRNDDYDPRNIQKIYKFENQIDHPHFQEAIALFKEAYQEISSKYYIRFAKQDAEGVWRTVDLNWSSI